MGSVTATSSDGLIKAGVIAAVIAPVLLLQGCLSPEVIRRIEGAPGEEGTGVFLSRVPEVIKILATYEATERQRQVTTERAKSAQAALEEKNAEVPRIIAVDTEPDDRRQGARTIMLWDTQTEEIVGSKVYDVDTPPKLGDVAMWETYSAQYVGVGREP